MEFLKDGSYERFGVLVVCFVAGWAVVGQIGRLTLKSR